MSSWVFSITRFLGTLALLILAYPSQKPNSRNKGAHIIILPLGNLDHECSNLVTNIVPRAPEYSHSIIYPQTLIVIVKATTLISICCARSWGL